MASQVESHIRDGSNQVKILQGASITAAIDLGGQRLAAIQTPAAWTAANFTFQVGVGDGADSAVYANMFDSGGNEYTVTAAASETIMLPYADFIGIRYIKIRSGTNGTPVNQAADRLLLLQRAA